jgi:arylsulfatase A-like enzyme
MSATTMEKPNILYIHSHDTGRYIQPYGHPVSTPNLQKFAEQGVLFRQAFCASPTCSPSRASLLTGQCAHSNGMLGLAHRGFTLQDYSQHLIHTLRKAGYLSALAGMQHIANAFAEPWKAIGYDLFLGDTRGGDDRTGETPPPFLRAALDFLDRPPSQPFFLSVGFEETHRKYPPLPPGLNPGYTLPPSPLPDTAEVRQDMARYKISAQNLDRKMGAVFDSLEWNGLAENTLVICTTDHGIAFPGMKCNLTAHGIGVMLILRGPGGFSGGEVLDSLVSHIDIYPTICDLIGIPRPDWLQGVSLLPLVRGEASEVREAVFAEVNYHAAYEPMRSVRTKRWSYIRRYEVLPHPVLPNCDNSPSKRLWMEHGWQELPPAPEALYDLIFDPNETNNLIDHPRCSEAAQEMRNRLENWLQSTQDPILQGHVPAPPGAILDDVNAISPT